MSPFLAVALSALLAAQTPAPSRPAVPPEAQAAGLSYHMMELNGRTVPILGRRSGPALDWRVEAQTFRPTPPGAEAPPAGTPLNRYTIAVNGAPVEVKGWVDASGVFRWRWDDQVGRLTAEDATAEVNPAGAMANGVELEGHDATGGIRASDPEAYADARTLMASGRCPDPDSCPPDRPDDGSGFDWRAVLFWGFVASLFGIGFVATFGVAIYMLITRSKRVA